MAVYSVLPPFLVFPDSDGTPLENGQIFIGQPGFEARSSPKASFFDTAQTIPTGTASGSAIRTMGGFPARNGSPAMFYVDGDFSISVLDRNGVLLYSALNTTLAINLGAITTGPILAPDGNVAAVGLGFINEANTGWIRSSAGTVQYIVQGAVVAQMTATGVTFNQTVGGAGFSAGVLAIAQPLSTALTTLATAGAIGTLKVSDGASDYDDITPGTTGQVLTGVTGGKPTFQPLPAPGGLTFLATLATTSGATVTQSSLTLTSYKQLLLVVNGVSSSGTNWQLQIGAAGLECSGSAPNASNVLFGSITIDLSTGIFWSAVSINSGAGTSSPLSGYAGDTSISTATTSITFDMSNGNFDAGSIDFYGVT